MRCDTIRYTIYDTRYTIRTRCGYDATRCDTLVRDNDGSLPPDRVREPIKFKLNSVCFAQTAALQLRGCCCAAVAAALQLVAAGCCVAAVCCGAASLHDADVWYYLLLFDAALLLNM